MTTLDDLGLAPPAAGAKPTTTLESLGLQPPTPRATPSIIESLWNTVSGVATAPARVGQGIVEGAVGMGIPEGRASQLEGGPARFAGRAIGTGGRSIAESLWEGIVKPPGQMVTGEMQPGPQAEQAARGMAMGMAGQGGFAPGRALPGLAERPPRLTLGGQPPSPVGPVGGNTRLATVQMPTGAPRTVQSPPLTPEQMPPGAPAAAPAEPPPVRPPIPSTPERDAATVSLYRQAVLPGTGRRSRAPQVKAHNDAITTGVDEIIGNQPNLRLTARNGTPLPPGSTVPGSVAQMSEALDQSETTLFQQWNPMTQRAGERGLRIELAPVVSDLRALAKTPEIAHVNPATARRMEDLADLYEKQGSYTPLEAQNVIKGINAERTALGLPDTTLEPIARRLRQALDEGIEAAEGPGWQELRNRYGALRSLDKDVTKAAERIANRPSGTLYKVGNFIASREFLHALMGNPKALVLAIGSKGATELTRFWNDPNRMIEQMFKQRMRGPQPAAPALLNPASRALQGLSLPQAGGFAPGQSGGLPQPKRDPDQPPRQPVF
jgi:hypothetical protein